MFKSKLSINIFSLLITGIIIATIFFVSGFNKNIFVDQAFANNGYSSFKPKCPFVSQQGRHIIEFNSFLRSDKNEQDAKSTIVPLNQIEAGFYKISLATYDNHFDKIDQVQPNESWKLRFLDQHGESLGNTNAISDLPDNKTTINEVVENNFFITKNAYFGKAVHSAYPSNNPNSLIAVCAVLDLQAKAPECSDGIDNDNDGTVDEQDSACHSDGDVTNENSYNKHGETENSKPVITLLGDNPIVILYGGDFIDPGAIAYDEEDGDIEVIVAGDAVDSTVSKTYVLLYNAEDSLGSRADEITRQVIVQSPNDEQGDGGGEPPPQEEEEEEPCNACGGEGGSEVPPVESSPAPSRGGGGPTYDPLLISNEKAVWLGDAIVVTWDTNIDATGRVYYGTTSPKALTLDPETIGYSTSSILFASTTKPHIVIITNADRSSTYYLRPSSQRSATIDVRTLGREIKLEPIILTLTNDSVVSTPISESAPIEIISKCTEYLTAYIKFGNQNAVDQVVRLQRFLRDVEGFKNTPQSGVYDEITREFVNVFQTKYRQDILEPWGLELPTGFVYITTKKKINELYCKFISTVREFPLTDAEKIEIALYRAELEQQRTLRNEPDWKPTTMEVGQTMPSSETPDKEPTAIASASEPDTTDNLSVTDKSEESLASSTGGSLDAKDILKDIKDSETRESLTSPSALRNLLGSLGGNISLNVSTPTFLGFLSLLLLILGAVVLAKSLRVQPENGVDVFSDDEQNKNNSDLYEDLNVSSNDNSSEHQIIHNNDIDNDKEMENKADKKNENYIQNTVKNPEQNKLNPAYDKSRDFRSREAYGNKGNRNRQNFQNRNKNFNSNRTEFKRDHNSSGAPNAS